MHRVLRSKYAELLIHIFGWVALLGSPLFMLDRGVVVDWSEVLRRLNLPLAMMIVFYVNFLILVPRLYERNKSTFTLANILMIAAISAILFYVIPNEKMRQARRQQQTEQVEPQIKKVPVKGWQGPPPPMDGRMHRRPEPPSPLFFILRDISGMIVCLIVAVLARLSKSLNAVEAARQEAELGRTEAELKNLRNQINPHFLLNTLNNIYALIQFNTDKAQVAVQDLSKLLRHALYDNQQDYVSLTSEVEFETKYINLMRIRLPQSADVTFKTDLPEQNIQIAPLLFISLLENAFKHGIRTSGEPCFIHVEITVRDTSIVCFKVENSNYPKAETDRSGSGIGLEQVQKRLDLMYPNRYHWLREVSADKSTYTSQVEIQTDPNKNI